MSGLATDKFRKKKHKIEDEEKESSNDIDSEFEALRNEVNTNEILDDYQNSYPIDEDFESLLASPDLFSQDIQQPLPPNAHQAFLDDNAVCVPLKPGSVQLSVRRQIIATNVINTSLVCRIIA